MHNNTTAVVVLRARRREQSFRSFVRPRQFLSTRANLVRIDRWRDETGDSLGRRDHERICDAPVQLTFLLPDRSGLEFVILRGSFRGADRLLGPHTGHRSGFIRGSILWPAGNWKRAH